MNNKRKYNLALGFQGCYYILFPLVCTVAIFSITSPGWFRQAEAWAGLAFPTFAYLGIITLHFCFSSVVLVNQEMHIVFMGIPIMKIPLQEIISIEHTSLGFGWMALGNNKIKIIIHDKKSVLLSIKDEADFLRKLEL